MIANRAQLLERLRADLLAEGLELPVAAMTDGRWHACRGGHYLLSLLPLLAMYCVADGEPVVWRHDDRLLSLAQQRAITEAVEMSPATRGLSATEDANVIPGFERIAR
jgi:hypothetical protein